MSEVYVGNLFTGEKASDRDKFQKYCFEHKIYAIGWAVDKKPSSIDEYENLAKSVDDWKDDVGLTMAINAMRSIEKNDFIWTRYSKNGTYLLGKVKKSGKEVSIDDFYSLYKNKNGKDLYCLSIPCQEWKIFSMDEVPGIILNSFRGQTVKHSSYSENIEDYCKNLYNGTLSKRNSLSTFKALLTPDDEEDLLGLYLQQEKQYLIYPSTNKRSTAAYEYILIRKNKNQIQKAIVQCKMGSDDINLNPLLKHKKIKSFENCEIYCVTDKGKTYYNNQEYKEGTIDTVHIISLDNLINWAKQNIDILPDRVKANLSITDF
jgi:hypothetical protein